MVCLCKNKFFFEASGVISVASGWQRNVSPYLPKNQLRDLFVCFVCYCFWCVSGGDAAVVFAAGAPASASCCCCW